MSVLKKYFIKNMKINSRLGGFFLAIFTITSFNLFADDRIRIHYHERPPYAITVGQGLVKGLTADVARVAFQSAGVPHYWVKTPSKRQMKIIKDNKGKDCLVGWMKNSEREKFAKYTKYIYQNKQMIGLALFSNTKIESGKTIEEIFQNKDLILLTKSGYSYGKLVDKLIEQYKPILYTVTVENINMLLMLNLARADYFFTTEAEMKGLIQSAGFSLGDYKSIKFTNMPLGNKRYILCSMNVEDEVIEKLNAWIK